MYLDDFWRAAAGLNSGVDRKGGGAEKADASVYANTLAAYSLGREYMCECLLV